MRDKKASETALYVRLPTSAGDKLARASDALGIPKKELIAGLVTRYVDPDSPRGLSALGALSGPRTANLALSAADQAVGTYSFQPHEPAEVMNAEQAAQLLQVDAALVVELAEAGTLPGRKLGTAWRFSRAALLAWLSRPEPGR